MASNDATLPGGFPTQGIAAVVLIAVYFAFPLIVYLIIMIRYCCGASLEFQLRKQGLLQVNRDTGKSMRNPARTSTRRQQLSSSNNFSTLAKQSIEEEVPKVLLSFRNVRYAVPGKDGKLFEILQGVDGWFKPGTLTAVMGPSGCGKSTLLDVLADLKDFGAVSGDIRVNGKPRTQQFRRVAAYVLQNDILLSNLTVRETLWFATELRLPEIKSNESKFDIVQRVLDDLGLDHVADSRIGNGDSAGGLSGGQKRRVTVAIELITNPSLIFLDEPTSGLDAYGSLQVISVLRKLADQGRTVVCTIHQPRSDIFKLFDMLLLMKFGRVMYFGENKGTLPFFKSCGVIIDNSVNPADFIVDLTHDKSLEESNRENDKLMQTLKDRSNNVNLSPTALQYLNNQIALIQKLQSEKSSVDVFVASYAQSRRYCANRKILALMHSGQYPTMPKGLNETTPIVVAEADGVKDAILSLSPEKAKTTQMGKYVTSFWKQTFTITRRAYIDDMRNSAYLMTWVLAGIMALFYGALYSSIELPTINQTQFDDVNTSMNVTGLITQNFSSLELITGYNQSQINSSVIECGESLNENVFLALARSGFLYQLLAANYFSEFPYVASIFLDKALFFREHNSRSYSSAAWCFSWYTRIFFTGLLKGLVFPPLVYFSGHLIPLPEPYFLFCIFMSTMSIAGATVAFLCATSITSLETASVAFVAVNIISQNLSAYFIYPNYIPPWFIWIYYINFFHYSYVGTVFSQTLKIPPGSSIDLYTESYQEIRVGVWWYAVVALIFCLAFMLAGVAATYFYNHKSEIQVFVNEKELKDEEERDMKYDENDVETEEDDLAMISNTNTDIKEIPIEAQNQVEDTLAPPEARETTLKGKKISVDFIVKLRNRHVATMKAAKKTAVDTDASEVGKLAGYISPGNALPDFSVNHPAATDDQHRNHHLDDDDDHAEQQETNDA